MRLALLWRNYVILICIRFALFPCVRLCLNSTYLVFRAKAVRLDQCFPWPKWGARVLMMTNSRARGQVRVMRRAAGRASRGGTRRNVRPDAPNKNYIIHWLWKTNNQSCIIAMLCTVCSTLITVKSSLDQCKSCNFSEFFREMLSKHTRHSFLFLFYFSYFLKMPSKWEHFAHITV